MLTPALSSPLLSLQARRQDGSVPGGHQAGRPAAQPCAEAEQGGGHRVNTQTRVNTRMQPVGNRTTRAAGCQPGSPAQPRRKLVPKRANQALQRRGTDSHRPSSDPARRWPASPIVLCAIVTSHSDAPPVIEQRSMGGMHTYHGFKGRRQGVYRSSRVCSGQSVQKGESCERMHHSCMGCGCTSAASGPAATPAVPSV